MTENTLKGAATETGGRIKEAAGAIVGDGSLKAEGVYDQMAGSAQRALGDTADAVRAGGRKITRQVEDQPVPALLVAGAVGFVLGYLAAR
ncbi:CsbD family protein [Roseixanthobacter glucoisosaccharinicivorans]|uniref:CsbD family protein n=1 Tax=Roseixanthobacter glucoisosaccharinicivorans TaxID=3119923 RepID=UPI00372C66E2